MNTKLQIALMGIVTFLFLYFGHSALATVYPNYDNATSCRGCHGQDVSDRHHLLVANGTFQCTDCHPMIYNNVTQTYYPQLIRDCLVCHPNKNHTQIHHILVSKGLFVCSDCHPVVFDNQTQTYSVQVTFDCPVCHPTVLSIQNNTPTPTPSPTPTPIVNNTPSITNITPISPVYNIVGDSRTFAITTDQIVDVNWFINNSLVQSDTGVTNSTYINTSASLGLWNVSAIASNINGTATYNWTWNVSLTLNIPPTMIGYAPYDPNSTIPTATDYAGTSRKFGIAIDQIANISWYINNSLVQSDINVSASSYINSTASPGTYNVNTVATNSNGSISEWWIWNVIPPVPYITSFDPISLIVNDTTGISRTFSVTTNQTANIAWYINGSNIQSNNTTTTANLGFLSIQRSYLGVSNISAIATNNYGTGINSWTWNVTPNFKTPIGSHALVDCTVCHVQQPQEVICYQCHNNSNNSANKTNIYKQFTMSNDTYAGMGVSKGYYPTVNTRHDITSTDWSYSSTQLKCTDCHSAHNASRPNVVKYPKNGTSFNKTMIHPGTGKTILDYVTYCLTCHDNTWSPNVTGPSIISNISYWYLINMTKGDWHGLASGDKYNNSFLIGPYASQAGKNNVPPMPCNDCHDSHGSSNLYHLLNLTDEYGTNYSINSSNVNSSDVDHWCSHCHKDPHQKPVAQNKQNNCLSSRCHSHGNRF